jgi:hypothetical protein
MTDLNARWFDQGTAADVAAAINMRRARIKWVSAHWVKEKWAQAQKRGDLPPFDRPHNGFPEGPRTILRRFVEVQREGVVV